ncbi:ABC transporter substrate-binding protein [Garciella nitratireducens]|uniref:Iron complex transport system substrate-binding protein n=1 Tax=Garciella nitratireducens DSM 15102 TaxID=1121911 RepID=A0A1T4MS23_9FIRM|nr:ABC transporter substrate-binding protein [Garciella nitratireducens]SJZ69636.1 iron complex transport system substrate-binding protein [Garciella nitratireducens DSM 15102]
MNGWRKVFVVIMIVFLTFTWTACSNTTHKENTTAGEKENTTIEEDKTTYPITITDDLGNKVTFEKAPKKIVSVAPSNTEILFALGLGDKIVGRDNYSNYPKEAQEIEVVGDFSGPNVEKIIDLSPDVVFAFSGIPEDAKKLLENSNIKVIVFYPSNIDGVLKNIETVGEIFNVQEEANKVAENMQKKRKEILEKVKNVEKKKVFIDIGDFYSAGPNSFIDSMLEEIHAENIAKDADTQYPQLSLEKIIESNPDVYITISTSKEEIKKLEGIQSINAFKNNNIIEIPMGTEENDMIQRSGPRIVDGLEILAKAIYPEAF